MKEPMSETHKIEHSLCGALTLAEFPKSKDSILRPGGFRNAEFHAEAVHLNGTRWDTRSLRVSLLGGSTAFRQRVASVAARWTSFAGIDFQFFSAPPGDIRVSLNQSGINRSELGIRARSVPPNLPTMELGRLTEDMPSSEFDYYVLHEFGHALGLVHEHQSPNQQIQWNRQRVVNDCRILFGWTEPMVEAEILTPFAAASVTATAFDRLSIMNYPVPDPWTLDSLVIPRAAALSPMDQAFIASLYPR
jgi:hypothetical protein